MPHEDSCAFRTQPLLHVQPLRCPGAGTARGWAVHAMEILGREQLVTGYASLEQCPVALTAPPEPQGLNFLGWHGLQLSHSNPVLASRGAGGE